MKIDELFGAAGIVPTGTIAWGEAPAHSGQGVYVVTIDPVADIRFDERIEQFRDRWIEGQPVVYIGRAVELDRRLRQFYRHRYGARSPHRGGQDILLLGCDKRVTWAAVEDRHDAEDRLIEAFCAANGRRPFGNRVRSARNLRAAQP